MIRMQIGSFSSSWGKNSYHALLIRDREEVLIRDREEVRG